MRLPASSALFPVAVLALLAGLTFWLDQANRDEGDGGRSKLRHDPDYWVDEFTVRRYGLDGTVRHALTAKRMEHFPDDDTTEIAQPRLIREHEGRPTTMTARTARLDGKGQHVRLIDDVRLVSAGDMASGKGAVESVITTSVLDVMPDEGYAYTRAPVAIVQGQSIIEGAGGLEINDKTRIAVISGPVRGTIRRQEK